MDNTTQRGLNDTVKPEKARVSPGSAAGRAMQPGYVQADHPDSEDGTNG